MPLLISFFFLFFSCITTAEVNRFNYLWVWEDTLNTQDSTNSLLEFYTNVGVDVGAVIIDSPWEQAFNDLVFDKSRYPDGVGFINNLKSRNIKVVGWITPYINTEGLPHSNSATFQKYSYSGVPVSWWKGAGYLMDFDIEATASAFFNQPSENLSYFDALKVDQVQQFTPTDEWLRLSLAWSKAAGIYASANGMKILSRGYSHQGGLQSYPSMVNWNWGGDYTGRSGDFHMQISDLCNSIEAGFQFPALEAGGYNPPASNKDELLFQLEVGSLFPVLILGGKSWADYKSYFENDASAVRVLKLKQSLNEVFKINDSKIVCSSNRKVLSRGDFLSLLSPAVLDFNVVHVLSGRVFNSGQNLPVGLYYKNLHKF